MKTRPNGFTLIELLVVIAIIAILAAILFPVFASAREKARQTTCASDQKQIMLACLQYSQDFDEYILSSTTDNGGSGWDDVIYPYVVTAANHHGNLNEWEICPDDNFPRPVGYGARTFSLNSGGAKFNKSISLDGPAGAWTTYGGAPAGGGNYAFTLNQIQDPSGTIMIAEDPDTKNQTGSQFDAYLGSPSKQVATDGTGPATPYHGAGWNYGFVDGHVKWYRPEQTVGKNGVGDCGTLGANGGSGTMTAPCGMWTVDPND